MMLCEDTPISTDDLPIGSFRFHLRLGTGFGDDALQDEVLARSLRAALAHIEGLIGKAILRRRFRLVLSAWGRDGAQTLPRAPVMQVETIVLQDRDGGRRSLAPDRWRLRRDEHRPSISPTGLSLPQIPSGGLAEITFLAGYAEDWEDVPADLAHAAMQLASVYYEERGGAGIALPASVHALLAPYRPVRLHAGECR